jgi:hypothetical protein
MTKISKTIICLVAGVLLSSGAIYAQDDFDKYLKEQQAAFERYKQQEQNAFNRYRDSVNREYAAHLEKHWEVFKLQKEEPPIKTPIPDPPVFDPMARKPKSEKIPVIPPSEPRLPFQPAKPLPQPPRPLPPARPLPTKPPTERHPDNVVKADFFGTTIAPKVFSRQARPLTGVSEKEIATYWNVLNEQPYNEWTNEIRRIRTDLNLNDWGMYLLIEKLFTVWFPSGTANERVVFTVFMLNQLNYRAKIGINQNELVPLLAFQNKIHNATFFRYGNDVEGEIRYSAFNPQHRDLSSIRSCSADYPDATLNIDMSIESLPLLSTSKRTKTMNYKDDSYKINYNNNLVDFYSTYPCVDFSVYAEAPMDRETLQNIESQVAQDIRNKSQEEAVNLLLHFVQLYFEYKTDTRQFGYERWFFAEETVASSYSDCEDRSILFAQLVRRILGMKVVLVYYPGIHLATAVKFDNPQTDGDYVTVDGAKYLICDPTYMRAGLGAAMPKLQGTGVNIIKLKDMARR